MSKYEEAAFPMGKAKVSAAQLKTQLTRLKNDLEQFLARKPDGAVIEPLRERIKHLESEIAAVEAGKTRDRQAQADAEADAADARKPAPKHVLRPQASTLFPPRRRG
jgi:phage shock protein A